MLVTMANCCIAVMVHPKAKHHLVHDLQGDREERKDHVDTLMASEFIFRSY